MIFATLWENITDPASILMTFLMFFGVLLIIIILLQKGRGGGLAGAFGGAGGQSALGTKAGDVFTKITIIMAVIWVILAGVSGITTRASSGKYSGGSAVSEKTEIGSDDKDKEEEKPATEEKPAGGPEFTPPKDLAEKETKAAEEKKPAATEEKATKPAEPASKDAAPKAAAPESKEVKKQETPAKPETTKSQPKSE